MQKYSAPSSQIPSSGVTCGRPSGRTVDSQYTSASRSSLRPVPHSVGIASWLLKALSSVTGSGSVIRVSQVCGFDRIEPRYGSPYTLAQPEAEPLT